MSPSAALSLRESFGDRKIPEISRKITACVACRKLKTKCHMNDNKPPCSRCKTRGLPCTVNKSLQMLLESDASWKETMEARIKKLEHALLESSRPHLSSSNLEPSKISMPREHSASRPPAASNMVTLNLSCGLGAFPASSILNMTFSANQSTPDRPDLVSREVIPYDTAETFFCFYQQNLDPCIHHVLAEADTLTTTRSRSSLLTAAICTVAAFCTGSNHYQDCFNTLTNEVSGKMFSSHYTFDDVRALCIGAFWLNEISSALNGLAVRIGTELDLHRCITKMPHDKRECYDRTRLYYLLYLCDHHSSLSHGRPPLTRDFHSLKNPRSFLQSKYSTQADLKLISQVELWSISSRVFDVFGADIENPIACPRSAELERLSDAYDQWYDEWIAVLPFDDDHDDPIPKKMFQLYSHSAKLYLFSHVFRGPAQGENPPIGSSEEGVGNFAQRALESALSIIRCIVDDDSNPQPWLEGLPLYFGTMTAFASVCLVKASSYQSVISDMNTNEIRDLLYRLTRRLQSSLALEHPTHPFLSIAGRRDRIRQSSSTVAVSHPRSAGLA
ncbi:hypothetical protein BJX96DRAFT_187757 [Aspergillus floccosus]